MRPAVVTIRHGRHHTPGRPACVLAAARSAANLRAVAVGSEELRAPVPAAPVEEGISRGGLHGAQLLAPTALLQAAVHLAVPASPSRAPVAVRRRAGAAAAEEGHPFALPPARIGA